VPPLPVGVSYSPQPFAEELMGYVAALVLVALMLPLGSMLYIDTLLLQKEVAEETKKLRQLRREIEQQQRKEKRNDKAT